VAFLVTQLKCLSDAIEAGQGAAVIGPICRSAAMRGIKMSRSLMLAASAHAGLNVEQLYLMRHAENSDLAKGGVQRLVQELAGRWANQCNSN
jgi:hypothetical protein